jgi:phage tail-like protein
MDPLKAFRFKVVIDGFQRAGFSEVTGLEKDTDEVKYREGGMNETERKSAGLSHFGDITLKRGQVFPGLGGDDMINWVEQVHSIQKGNAVKYRKDIEIQQLNFLNTVACTWRISDAWPKKFKPMSDLKGDSSADSYEEIVLSHEGFEKIKG